MSAVAAVLIVTGALLTGLAGLGILRLPDVYTRLHAASKAGPLGAGLMLLGAAFESGDPLIALRAVLGLVFLILTAPVSSHLLARAALKAGIPLDPRTNIDQDSAKALSIDRPENQSRTH